MDLFDRAKAVRLRSHHGKYLMAEEDEERVTQSRDGSAPGARWEVEFVDGGRALSFRSCYGRYLAATSEAFLLGFTGKKVMQDYPGAAARRDSSFEWEPLREGFQVKLKSRSGQFLRANGSIPPWRHSVTHDLPHRTATQDWVLWDVDIVQIQVQPAAAAAIPAPAKKASSAVPAQPPPPPSAEPPRRTPPPPPPPSAEPPRRTPPPSAEPPRRTPPPSAEPPRRTPPPSAEPPRRTPPPSAEPPPRPLPPSAEPPRRPPPQRPAPPSAEPPFRPPVQINSGGSFPPDPPDTDESPERRSSAWSRSSSHSNDSSPRSTSSPQNEKAASPPSSNPQPQAFSSFAASPQGRTIYYTVADDRGNVDDGAEWPSLTYTGTSVPELTRRLKKTTGLDDIILCTRHPVRHSLSPIYLQLPPNNRSMWIVVVDAESSFGKNFDI